jgi:hypothetical protein
MAHGIGAVGSEADLQHMIALQAKLDRGGCSGNSSGIEHHDAIVAMAKAQFILRTDHAVAVLSADPALLDDDARSVGHAQVGPHRGNQHLLSGRHIGRTADDLHRITVAEIDLGNAEAVRIRMLPTLQHMAHHHPFQHALDGLMQLHALTLQAGACENVGRLPGSKAGISILYEPVPGYAHVMDGRSCEDIPPDPSGMAAKPDRHCSFARRSWTISRSPSPCSSC